jgi:hypothetical protein
MNKMQRHGEPSWAIGTLSRPALPATRTEGGRKGMKRQIVRIFCAVLGVGLLVGCSGGFGPGRVGPKGTLGPQGDVGASSSDFPQDAIVIERSGVLVTKEYAFTDFSQLEIVFFDAEVRQGEGYSVVLEMDENVLDHVQVARSGETLRIGLDPSEAYRMEGIHMRAEVTMPSLTGLTMDLVDDAAVSGFQSDNDLVIDLSKSSLHGDVHAGNIEITAEVGSRVDLNGSAADVTIRAAVDSNVDLSELACDDATVTAEVNSEVTVHPAGRLDADASASKVLYIGDPALGEIKSELGGSVEKQ